MRLKGRSGREASLRVVIADDNMLLPVAVRALLEPDADIEVAGVIYESDRVLPGVGELQPDLLLLGSGMLGTGVLGVLDRLCALHPAVAVVLLTESLDPDLASAAYERGAKGVIVKGSHPGALAPLPHGKQVVLKRLSGQRVHRCERLVHQQHLGFGCHGAGETGALLHAAGQLMRIFCVEAGETDNANEFVNTRTLVAWPAAAAADQVAQQGDIAGRLQPRHQVRLLEYKADAAGPAQVARR